MSDTFGQRRSFDIGRVFERTFGAIGANGLPLLLISLVFVALPQAVWTWGQSFFLDQAFDQTSWATPILITIAGVFVTVACNVVMQGVVTHTVVADLQGRKATLGESIRATLGSFWVLLAVGLISGLAMGVGLILLVVPGILIFLIWMVAGPVVIAERAGVGRALDRSRTLTRNHRWWLLLLGFIYVVVSWVLSAIVGVASVAAGGFQFGDTFNAVTLIVIPVTQALTSLIWAAMVAAAYVELRTVKEGGGRDSVAAIFD